MTHRTLIAGLALLSCSCASLPDVDPWLAYGGTQSAAGSGTRRPLTQRQADAILARLPQKDRGLLQRQAALEEAVAGTPLVAGNDVILLNDGAATYQAMFEDIERAVDHVNIEFYTIEDDAIGRRLAKMLRRKTAQGVAVNVIYDGVGSHRTRREYFDGLRAAGVNVFEFNPVNPLTAVTGWRLNHRDHRKLVIIDGRIAYTGGINISGVYSGGSMTPESRGGGTGPAWRDTNVRIAGPVVADLQKLYLDTWQKHCSEPLAPRNWFPAVPARGKHPARAIGSTPDDAVPAIYVALVSAIRNATRSVRLTMAYFAPDPQTLEALKDAARRGVSVQLILPSYTDFWGIFHAGRSHYSDLLQAGVEIFERQERLLHSKTAVIDGVWSTVGSSNIDWRSFLHNNELNVVVLGEDFGRQMEQAFQADLAQSRRIQPDEWSRRPLSLRIKERAARLWEYWL